MFSTSNSPDLYSLTSCTVLRKKLVFNPATRNISDLNENYRRYNFQAFASISRNIKFTKKLQLYVTLYHQQQIHIIITVIKLANLARNISHSKWRCSKQGNQLALWKETHMSVSLQQSKYTTHRQC